MKKFLLLFFTLILLQVVKAKTLHRANSMRIATYAGVNGSPQIALPDTTLASIVNTSPISVYQNVIFKRRLDSVKKEVPLDYNEYVQGYIDNYTAPRRREEVGRILGLTKYYFPIYEKAFHDAGIPEEIKFLSIVESELNPNAVSRVGATGPWQFMFSTAKQYGLNIDTYVDERRDPIQASTAAAAYIKDAYLEFGDWLLAIASYNCGKDNIARAIEKAGTNDFWAIRQYLPVETRGYVPAYIAVAYVMNYYKRHNISPQACDFSIKTDTVLVNKFVSLNSVSKVLGLSVRELAILNPAYTRQVINGSANSPRRLIIPQTFKRKYATAYKSLNNDGPVIEPKANYISYTEEKNPEVPTFHKVKRGETLDDIADKYGVDVEDLKLWNHRRTNKAVMGERLRLTEEPSSENTSAKRKHASVT